MLGYHCPDCVALFAEMQSAIMEANAITEHASALRRAGNNSRADPQKWGETKQSWENARRRWLAASTDLLSHLAKHRRSTPTSAKCFVPNLYGNKDGRHFNIARSRQQRCWEITPRAGWRQLEPRTMTLF